MRLHKTNATSVPGDGLDIVPILEKFDNGTMVLLLLRGIDDVSATLDGWELFSLLCSLLNFFIFIIKNTKERLSTDLTPEKWVATERGWAQSGPDLSLASLWPQSSSWTDFKMTISSGTSRPCGTWPTKGGLMVGIS